MLAIVAEIIALDRLVDEQILREAGQQIGMLAQQRLALGIGLIEDVLDFFVDRGGSLLGIALRGAEIAADEDAVARIVERDGAELLRHAVFHDHVAGDVRRLLDVTGRTGGNILEEELLGNAAAERGDDAVKHLAAGREVLRVLGLAVPSEAAGRAARDDRDIVHGVGVLEEERRDRVAGLVVRRQAARTLGHDAALLLRAHDNLEDRLVDIRLHDEAALAARGHDGSLVEEILQIRAGKAGRAARDALEIDIVAQRLAAGVDLQDLLAALNVGQAHIHAPVKAAGAQQRVIENVGAVGRRHDDDALVIREAVHFDEQLVERLLTLIMAAAEAAAALTADRVDLVDEHNGRGNLLGLVKQVTHARGADADIELDKIRA